MDREIVKGYCPMGCGETLFLGDGGHVTCSLLGCPRPSAVDEILCEREGEHVVEILPRTFNVLHPLRERIDGALLDCELGAWLKSQHGPPVKPGRYRVTAQDGDPVAPWAFEKLT